jgi:hypothetical protein
MEQRPDTPAPQCVNRVAWPKWRKPRRPNLKKPRL